jgi:hypothetical protein
LFPIQETIIVSWPSKNRLNVQKEKNNYLPLFLPVREGNRVCGSIKWAVDRGLPTVDDFKIFNNPF